MSDRPRIVVTRKIFDEALDVLREIGDVSYPNPDRQLFGEDLRDAICGADGILTTLQERVDGAFLDSAGPQLKVIANIAVGYDNVDVAAVTDRGIAFTNTPGVLTDATADIAFGLLLAVTRRLGEGERLLRSRTPWSFSLDFMLGSGVQEKVLGIVGLGQIGQAMARRARAFGMDIVYSGRRRANPDIEQDLSAQYVTLDELLRTSDVVSLHCPLTPETRHLINAQALAKMKPTAYLINTTRGQVVDEAALANAVAEGIIAGAGLDVFENEPDVHPALLKLDNVALAPHLGSATIETRTAMAVLAARNVAAVLTGGEPLTPVKS